MNLIEELGIEKARAIVDGAPDWADIFCTSSDEYFITEGDEPKCCICLENLRTAIAEHGTPTNKGTDNLSHFDHCTDIRNHISPLTGVIER
ncbi:hypothetical protein [Acinetobacter bohemicus]|uniref:hypothetical protein n=1 Tax=Acinetobacter bohemicus TaxID=1435036 RepID=UPI004043077F